MTGAESPGPAAYDSRIRPNFLTSNSRYFTILSNIFSYLIPRNERFYFYRTVKI
ncbi:hypothetical protein [Leptospira noguchii]|uniref:Uncharacterized protein n=1 Tax=Leptospira noguchii str. 2001034031 TaxID=1193053 RepID=M6Y0J2_9LEPT|nr:hypothetical protein [Leptospira noguchii]EMO87210.1 hypothetical protein LEP1GSC024_2309 [Leptospira noguchii str. 2001034031]